MNIRKSASIAFCSLCWLSFSSVAELQDQGLNSVLLIIDRAITDVNSVSDSSGQLNAEELTAKQNNAGATIVNLSRTLGTLSYSRLQCGEAGVLAEFTQRVQLVLDEQRDPMRDAFQEGFDKSQSETSLLSEDECKRLTQSRQRDDTEEVANVTTNEKSRKDAEIKEVIEEKPEEDPKKSFLRVAELTGQLGYKRRFCDDKKTYNRNYKDYIESIPEEYLKEVKTAYQKGYKHGKRLNKNLSKSQCS